MPIVSNGVIHYQVKSMEAQHAFENPILSMTPGDYAHRLAMFAAEHVCGATEPSENTTTTQADASSTTADDPNTEVDKDPQTLDPSVAPIPKSRPSGIAKQILTYLTEHYIATTNELLTHIGCSRQALNKNANKLIEDGHIERIERGVYELITLNHL